MSACREPFDTGIKPSCGLELPCGEAGYKIQHCHCSGLSHRCISDLIPDHGCSKKKQKKAEMVWKPLLPGHLNMFLLTPKLSFTCHKRIPEVWASKNSAANPGEPESPSGSSTTPHLWRPLLGSMRQFGAKTSKQRLFTHQHIVDFD